jgi:hypothetical protein
MVKHLLSVFILFPLLIFSAEFSASVTKKHVRIGDSLTLQLTLKDASAQSPPSIDPLTTSFHIRSQQQTSNTMIMNGRASTSLTWTIILQPQQEGEALIPPITINTSEGVLTTNPIMIQVTQEAASGTKSSEVDDIVLITEMSTNHPYKNEPFFLTLTLKSKIDLANVNMPKFSIEDAIVEPNGEPRVEKKIVDGIRLNTVTFNYLVTPLNAGTLHIPSITLQGAMPVKRKTQSNSFFDHDFDPFFLMPGFDRLQPFTTASTPVTLNVQPAVAGIVPWLPARNLTIEESWDPSQKLEVGEPITRSIKIVAEGILSSQLPDLSERQNRDQHLKVYADKPVIGDEIKEKTIHSYRLEQYTLIPQQSGNLTLPEITLEWWDVAKNEKAVASLPSRSVEIHPNIHSVKNIPSTTTTQDLSVSATIPDSSIQRDPLLYGLIAGLAILLIAAMIWVTVLQKKISQITSPPKADKPKPQQTVQPPKPKAKPKDKNEKLPDLNPT